MFAEHLTSEGALLGVEKRLERAQPALPIHRKLKLEPRPHSWRCHALTIQESLSKTDAKNFRVQLGSRNTGVKGSENRSRRTCSEGSGNPSRRSCSGGGPARLALHGKMRLASRPLPVPRIPTDFPPYAIVQPTKIQSVRGSPSRNGEARRKCAAKPKRSAGCGGTLLTRVRVIQRLRGGGGWVDVVKPNQLTSPSPPPKPAARHAPSPATYTAVTGGGGNCDGRMNSRF